MGYSVELLFDLMEVCPHIIANRAALRQIHKICHSFQWIVDFVGDRSRQSPNGGKTLSRSQSLFGLLLLSDVPRNFGCTDHSSCFISYWRDSQRNIDSPAVAGQPYGLVVFYPVSAADRFQDLPFLVLQLRWNDGGNGLSDHI